MSKILIVEDDPEIAMLERDYLEIEGFETQVTDNGQMAITQAVTGDYDLILLDLMLPGCSGYDVCRVIRDKTDVPIDGHRPDGVGGQDPGPWPGGG